MTDADHEERLEQLIAEYLAAEDAGTPPDRAEFLAAHPELADDLGSFFRAHDRIGRLAAPLRAAAAEAEPAGTRPADAPTAETSPPAGPLSVPPRRDAATVDGPGPLAGPTPGQRDTKTANSDGLAETDPNRERGTRVRCFGDYEIHKELGRGGMGVVYKARQISLNRPVALKMIRSGELADEAELRRFQNEAEAVAMMDHPGIVSVYEVGQHDGQRYFSMKLIDGGSLAARLDRYRDNPRAVARLVAEAAQAVGHAHRRGLLHRDLKPANILLDDQGHSHITDFGLAKKVEGGSELTQSGAILGTPAYMAPEQASGRRGAVTTASDVYGLGAILYALLTGRAPFGGDSVAETLQAVREQVPSPPSKHNPRVPRDLEVICLRCLEKDPRRRYASAEALAEDLSHWLAGEPIAARPVGQAARLWRWCRRKPVVAGLLAAVAATLLLGMGTAWLFALQARGEAQRANREADMTRRQLYIAKIQLAQNAWRDSEIVSLRKLLNDLCPGEGQEDLRGFEWHYLWRLCHSELLTLRGIKAAMSPDGNRIASVDGAGITVFNATTGQEERHLECRPPWSFAPSLAFSPDGHRLAGIEGKRVADGSHAGERVKLWDVNSGREVFATNAHAFPINGVAFSPDGQTLASGSGYTPQNDWDGGPSGGEVRVWSLATGQATFTVKYSSSVQSVAFNPINQHLIWTTFDAIRIRDMKLGQEVRTIEARNPSVPLGGDPGLAFCKDGNHFATIGSDDGTVKVWNATTGQVERTLYGHVDRVTSVAFSPDGHHLATGSWDKTVKLWNLITGQEERAYKGHTERVSSVDFSPDGKRLASGSWDKTVRVWDATTSQEAILFQGRCPVITAVAFSPDGKSLAASSTNEVVDVWDVATRRLALTYVHPRSVYCVAFSPDGKLLASGDGEPEGKPGTVRVWNAQTGLTVFSYTAPPGSEVMFTGVAFSPDSRRVVAVSPDQSVKAWDLTTGKEILWPKGQPGPVNEVAFSPDGQRLAGVVVRAQQGDGNRSEVSVWDSRTGQEMLRIHAHLTKVTGLAYSRDGKLLGVLPARLPESIRLIC
jgi:WD40 repeat protein/tRNA A-37 threonylcarbamoyl transferase component Bud32